VGHPHGRHPLAWSHLLSHGGDVPRMGPSPGSCRGSSRYSHGSGWWLIHSVVRVIRIDRFNGHVSRSAVVARVSRDALESSLRDVPSPHSFHQSSPVTVWGSWGSRPWSRVDESVSPVAWVIRVRSSCGSSTSTVGSLSLQESIPFTSRGLRCLPPCHRRSVALSWRCYGRCNEPYGSDKLVRLGHCR
jgi:hypothetical protein